MAAIKIDFSLDDDIFDGVHIPLKKVPGVKELNKATQAKLDGEDPLADIISRALDNREWYEDAAVVLIHVQECLACGSHHAFSHGWFTSYTHRSDPHAKRLAKGKPLGNWPLKVERVHVATVDACNDCAESQILIEEACRGR